jgi:tetratricopeptide (TPR) repeat protein
MPHALSRLAILLVCLGGCHGYTVTRVYGGETEEGRFISERAYAHYGRGAEAEQRGDWAAAERSFGLAAAIDPEAPAPHARLGAVVCKARGLAAAREHFARALERAEGFAPALLEHARCAEAARELPLALELAEAAVRAEPSADEPSLLWASLLERAGRAERALEVLQAKRLLGPSSRTLDEALVRLARALGRAGTVARVEASPASGGPHEDAARPRGLTGASLPALDRALTAGELPLAHRLARAQGLELGTEALRLVLLGHASAGRDRARLALDAEPESADARVALALAYEALGELSLSASTLASVPDASRAPTVLAKHALVEAVARRVGVDAARAVASTLAPLSAEQGQDPLLRELGQRAARRLGAASK